MTKVVSSAEKVIKALNSHGPQMAMKVNRPPLDIKTPPSSHTVTGISSATNRTANNASRIKRGITGSREGRRKENYALANVRR